MYYYKSHRNGKIISADQIEAGYLYAKKFRPAMSERFYRVQLGCDWWLELIQEKNVVDELVKANMLREAADECVRRHSCTPLQAMNVVVMMAEFLA